MQRYEFPINIIDTILPLFYTIKLVVVKKSKEGSISNRSFLYTLLNNIIGKKTTSKPAHSKKHSYLGLQ